VSAERTTSEVGQAGAKERGRAGQHMPGRDKARPGGSMIDRATAYRVGGGIFSPSPGCMPELEPGFIA
jgi:hypothetical protein